jgi:hypothetical protein
LEDESSRARQALELLENPCGTQGYRSVGIVAASVHYTGDNGGIRWSCLLGYRQCIEIGAKADCRFTLAHIGDETCSFGANGGLDVPVEQGLSDLAGRAMLIPPDLWILVEVASHFHHLGSDVCGKARERRDSVGHARIVVNRRRRAARS